MLEKGLRIPPQFDFFTLPVSDRFCKNLAYLVSTMTCYLVCASFGEIVEQTIKLFLTRSVVKKVSEKRPNMVQLYMLTH